MTNVFEAWLKNFPRYQQEWMFERSRFAVSVKARQIGISTATAAKMVFRGLTERRQQLVISASQQLSDEVLRKARDHCEVLRAGGIKSATDFVENNATTLEWRGGGIIRALPSNPRTARSFSGDVYLDEYAYHLDTVGIRDAVNAMAIHSDYCLNVFSTPNGATGDFYDLVSSPPKGWVVHSVDIDRAIADGFRVDKQMLLDTVAGGDQRLFDQWFMCKFLDADLQYYPTTMVEAAQRWEGKLPDLRQCTIYAGFDVGRLVDLSALTVIAIYRGVAYQVATMTWKRTSYAEQRAALTSARDVFGWEKLFVDATGIGSGLAEDLVEAWGGGKDDEDGEVQPLMFTAPLKEELVTRGLRWLRDGHVRFERGDEGQALASELVRMRRLVTTSNNIQYEIPRSKTGHGDIAWSWLLALKGAGEPPVRREMINSPLMAVP